MAKILEFNRQAEITSIDVEDLLAKTKHLTATQVGMFMHLLMHCCTTGRRLPDDDEALATIARVSLRKWRNNRHAIMALIDHGRPVICWE